MHIIITKKIEKHAKLVENRKDGIYMHNNIGIEMRVFISNPEKFFN